MLRLTSRQLTRQKKLNRRKYQDASFLPMQLVLTVHTTMYTVLIMHMGGEAKA